MIACRIHVTGKVQGVFYRASTKEKAIDLGLKGWVKNEPDGSVLLEAEGEEEPLKALMEWCKKGPPLARVQDVTLESIPVKGYTKFEVTY